MSPKYRQADICKFQEASGRRQHFLPPHSGYCFTQSLREVQSSGEVRVEFSSVAQSYPTLCDPVDCSMLSITNFRSLLKLMSIKSVMPTNGLILCHPLLLTSVFSSIRSFSVSQFFSSGGQSIGVSASSSVRPMNIQD